MIMHGLAALAIAAALCFPSTAAIATTWRVGAGLALTLPSQAAAVAKDGDTVIIERGSYVDCAVWTQNNLVIMGDGSYPHVRDRCCGGKAIWVIQGRNTKVLNIEFSGAAVPDKNGAGIRQEGRDLLVLNCFFHDNENGILAGANKASRIRIEHSVFDNNGYGDGYSHNMYIGNVGSFELSASWSHRAKVGHNVKSRADTTRIMYSRISNEADGTASRDIDVPNGGWTLLLGNEVQHGPQTQNSNSIGYGLEGLSNPSHALLLVNNTLVNQRGSGSFVQIPASGTDTLTMLNNLLVGTGPFLVGASARVDSQANMQLRNIADARFTDPVNYDYRLTALSPAIDAGIDPGDAFRPGMQYVHPDNAEVRAISGAIDIGAHEYVPPVAVGGTNPAEDELPRLEQNFPNPCSVATSVSFSLPREGFVSIQIVSLLGEEVLRLAGGVFPAGRHTLECSVAALPDGVYWCRMTAATAVRARLLVVQ